MREEKHYLDEQWDDLPLPDQEKAWQKMQQLLDDDNRRRPLLPLWMRRYGGFALLLIGLGVAGSYLFTPGNEKRNGSSATEEVSQKTGQPLSSTTNTENQIITESSKEYTNSTYGDQTVSNKFSASTTSNENATTSNTMLEKNKARNYSTKTKEKRNVGRPVDGNEQPFTTIDSDNKNPAAERTLKVEAVAPLLPLLYIPVQLKDSTIKRTSLPIAKAKQPDDQDISSKLIFSAGVGLQQAIAFDGQHTTDYNYHGNRNAIADRIPSVYFRLQKKAWFVQAEYQYAVPQPVKQVTFSQKTSYTATNQNLNTEQFTIQKLYYHHLPFSINYYVLPGWSVGTGALYSILAGAVTEQEITSKNVQTGSESVTKSMAPIKGYKDSFLYKTTTGIMLQSDYQWKRFSVGLRFTQNLQPFIKYTAPNGEVLDEKNKTLQAILRFRLF